MSYKKAQNSAKKLSETILSPVVSLLAAMKFTPNTVTWIGLFITIGGAYFVYLGDFLTGGLIILGASIFDILDGALARRLNKKSKFGGFLDSVTDRLSEAVIYAALIIFYMDSLNKEGVLLTFGVMFFTLMVSYLRARAGGLKIDCSVGIFTRPERMLVLILALTFDWVIPALWIILILSVITVIQRFMLVARTSK